ncbi:MAG: hypothetical protein JW821_00005, partial [Deltaproteobacteria bacterium]|nr:hypothetical protein [Deltaproteobacteria bacterium]
MDKPVQGKEVEPVLPKEELTEEDMDRIREVFSEEIVPKLARRQARIGVLGCGFAGPEYSRWAVR